MDRKWVTRAYEPGDEDRLMALWKMAFSDGESGRAELDYWNWQFRAPPAGAGRFRLAVVDDQIVGEIGFDNDDAGEPWDAIKQRNVMPDLKSIGGTSAGDIGGGDWDSENKEKGPVEPPKPPIP